MSEPVQGSCLCGAVRFAVTGSFGGLFLCHCSRCRKATGSAHNANLFAPGGEVTWLGGSDRIGHYRVSGTRHQRSFCMSCGSPVPSFHAEIGALMVPAGTLDTPVETGPITHICWTSRASWTDEIVAAPRLDGLPGISTAAG